MDTSKRKRGIIRWSFDYRPSKVPSSRHTYGEVFCIRALFFTESTIIISLKKKKREKWERVLVWSPIIYEVRKDGLEDLIRQKMGEGIVTHTFLTENIPRGVLEQVLPRLRKRTLFSFNNRKIFFSSFIVLRAFL